MVRGVAARDALAPVVCTSAPGGAAVVFAGENQTNPKEYWYDLAL